MAFTLRDFRDLLDLLQQHPEWRVELRRMLLSEELLTLPELVRELTQEVRQQAVHLSQLTQRVEQLTLRIDDLALRLNQLTERVDQLAQKLEQLTLRVDQLTARVDELTQLVIDLTRRMDELTLRVDQLTARVDELTQLVSDLTQRVDELTANVQKLAMSQQRMADDIAQLKKFYHEQKYFTRAHAYFSKLLKRIRALPPEEISAMLDDLEEQGTLTPHEVADLLQADVIVRGRRRDDGQEVYLVVEASWGVGMKDVQRAARRAQTLSKAGLLAVPVVAGEGIDPNAHQSAREMGVTVVLDGALEQELE
ncbi:MAG: hypothetical protein HPY54_01980 [Chthonomonadetes bacterium]|nr:hypothetical protein [Chthonomonadetes bacterium]